MSGWKESVYWFVAGAAVGLGLILSASLGIPLLLLGGALIVYATYKRLTNSYWAGIVGLGIGPAVLLFIVYFTSVPCPPEISEALAQPGAVVDTTCVPSLEIYLYMALAFLALVLVGVTWGVLRLRMSRKAAP